jgi:uncharacterized protein YjiS (DUF1127 family)
MSWRDTIVFAILGVAPEGEAFCFLARLGRLVNGWVAAGITRYERHVALVALCQLDDRELKDFGIHRCQIYNAIEQAATFK